MNKTMVEVPVFVFTVENHAEVKDELLQLIADTPSGPHKMWGQDIGNTDWFTPSDTPRPYYDKMIETLLPYIHQFCMEMQADHVKRENVWFQQYEHSEWHGWHIHPGSMYGLVYYVELPDGATPTNLLVHKDVVVPDAKEGDVLFFPSILFHRSPANTGAGRKTVLVMNLNLDGYAP